MHEDLTSYDCIVLIIYCLSSHHTYKIINSIKFQNWFQPQLILTFILHSQDWEREYSILYGYSFICILLFASFIILYNTPVHYHWDRGGSALCTYVPSCVLYSRCSLYVLWLLWLVPFVMFTSSFSMVDHLQLHLQHSFLY